MKRYVLVLTALLIPGALHAQEPATAWKGIDRAARSTVFVLDDEGVETRGQLLRLDPDAIVVLVNGAERRFETERVARVSKRGDSLKNGARNGAIAGIVAGVLATVSVSCGGDSSCREIMAGRAILQTVLYAAIGTAIDASIQGRTTLYEAPPRKRAIQSGGGAALSVRFTW